MKKSLSIKYLSGVCFAICYLLLPFVVESKEIAVTTDANEVRLIADANEMNLMPEHSEIYVLPDANEMRLISLAPSITEMIVALEKDHLLVGRTLYSTSPESLLDLPIIGSYYKPDLEKILSLKPDLCIAIADGTPKEIINRLQSLGVEVLVLNPEDLESLKGSLLELASALDAGNKAQELLVQMNAEFERAEQRMQNIENIKPPKVLLQLQESPLIVVSGQSFLGELIDKAGGHNIVNSDKLYPILSLEEVLTMNPDIILILGMGSENVNQAAITTWNKWDKISAVQNKRIYILEEDYFTRPSIHTPEAIHALIDIFHGRSDEI